MTKALVHEEVTWLMLQNQVLDSRFEIGPFLQAVGSHAFFHARDLDAGTSPHYDLLLRIEECEQPGAAEKLNRFREASFLNHPNLVHVYGTGQFQVHGKSFLYLVTELAELDLAEALRETPLTLPEVSSLVKQVAAGLQYMHAENFVYCALCAGSVWRVGSQWKLADFSQMRIPGRYPLAETRKLLITPALDAPPEANEGEVLETWDVWSLGSMLRKILLRSFGQADAKSNPSRSGSVSRISIPVPYDQILGEALDPDPAARATLGRIVAVLTSAENQIRAREPQPQPQPLPVSQASEVKPLQFLNHSPRSTDGRRSAILGLSLAGIVLAASWFGFQRLHHQSPVPSKADQASPAVLQPKLPSPEPKRNPFGEGKPVVAGNSTQAITALLQQWADATRSRNVEAEVGCYAPVVDRFYGQRRVSTSQLRRQEQSVFSRIGAVRRFEISNINVKKIAPDWAVVSFDKVWDFGNRTRFAGSAQDELVLRPVHGEWKISSQREVKVYWVDKQAI